jgi:hypothetical protein
MAQQAALETDRTHFVARSPAWAQALARHLPPPGRDLSGNRRARGLADDLARPAGQPVAGLGAQRHGRPRGVGARLRPPHQRRAAADGTGLRFFVDSLLDVDPCRSWSRPRSMPAWRPPSSASGARRCAVGCHQHAVGPVALRRPRAHLEDQYSPAAHRFRRPEPRPALVVLVGEDGTVENRAIEVPQGCRSRRWSMVANYLNRRFQGRTLPKSAARHQEVEHVKRELDEVSAAVVEAGLATWVGAARTWRKRA